MPRSSTCHKTWVGLNRKAAGVKRLAAVAVVTPAVTGLTVRGPFAYACVSGSQLEGEAARPMVSQSATNLLGDWMNARKRKHAGLRIHDLHWLHA